MPDTLNIKPGDKLPEFTLTAVQPDGSLSEVTNQSLRGKAAVIFFFPKADTPG